MVHTKRQTGLVAATAQQGASSAHESGSVQDAKPVTHGAKVVGLMLQARVAPTRAWPALLAAMIFVLVGCTPAASAEGRLVSAGVGETIDEAWQAPKLKGVLTGDRLGAHVGFVLATDFAPDAGDDLSEMAWDATVKKASTADALRLKNETLMMGLPTVILLPMENFNESWVRGQGYEPTVSAVHGHRVMTAAMTHLDTYVVWCDDEAAAMIETALTPSFTYLAQNWRFSLALDDLVPRLRAEADAQIAPVIPWWTSPQVREEIKSLRENLSKSDTSTRELNAVERLATLMPPLVSAAILGEADDLRTRMRSNAEGYAEEIDALDNRRQEAEGAFWTITTLLVTVLLAFLAIGVDLAWRGRQARKRVLVEGPAGQRQTKQKKRRKVL